MTPLLAGVDPGLSPDTLCGLEEGPATPGMETVPLGCLEVLGGPVRPPCDC